MSNENKSDNYKKALRFILLLGVVSLFADMTYESARSITGPFLQVLGADAAIVGMVTGFGELVSYGLRFYTGWLADRTRKYWLLIIIGYGVNVLVVPFIGLAPVWQIAAALIITERLGKAIRTPARDALLSRATAVTGHGKGFGLHEAMDQIGAITGPLIISGVFFWGGNYTMGFAVLFIPAVASLAVLIAARSKYPQPRQFETEEEKGEKSKNSHSFILYLIGIGLIALGFADFPLLAYHFKQVNLFSDQGIPLVYAMAMAVDAVAGLGLGTLFDRWKRPVLVGGVIVTAGFAPLAFLGGKLWTILGVILWGVGMGMIESVLRASVARMIPAGNRGRAYGIFNGVFGLAWFAGSSAAGWLYEINILGMVIFLVLAQLLAIPFLWKAFSR
ncbi:MAG TPA: MFS transporter [Balneolaceae bacterium]|nr:MFS transporter [Balneolaceae bacterium]